MPEDDPDVYMTTSDPVVAYLWWVSEIFESTVVLVTPSEDNFFNRTGGFYYYYF